MSESTSHLSSDHFNIPGVQKAWRATRTGDPSKALSLEHNVPVPAVLAKGEVLVKVQAAALNPAGYKLMRHLPNFIAKRPYIAENDIAGVVVNANGTDFQNGQEVFGCVPPDLQFKSHQGALAEYIHIPAANLAVRPANIKPTQAAGLGVVGLTAYQALYNIAKLEPHMSIFINGGSTSVGIMAIQLAKSIGCKVTASGSGKNEDLLRSLGADEFIDYKKEPVYKALEREPPSPKFHVILEAVGNIDLLLYTHSEGYLAPGGIFVSVGPQPSGFKDIPSLARYALEAYVRPTWLGGTKRQWSMITLKGRREDLEELSRLVSEDKLKPVVDSVFSFEDALKAYDRIMTKHATGKVVVKVEPDVE